MTPKTIFSESISKAQYSIILYELISDTSLRGIRKDWEMKVKTLMHWNAGDEILRVYGKNRDSLLLVRNPEAAVRQHFSSEFTSELLRYSIVISVAALDRYLHDLVTGKAWSVLGYKEKNIPGVWKNIHISAVETRKALDRKRRDPRSRPGNQIRNLIQEKIHTEPFQDPDAIMKAIKLSGKLATSRNGWDDLARHIRGITGDRLRAELDSLHKRRNKIVHEVDMVRKIRGKKITRHPISLSYCKDTIQLVTNLVGAIEQSN